MLNCREQAVPIGAEMAERIASEEWSEEAERSLRPDTMALSSSALSAVRAEELAPTQRRIRDVRQAYGQTRRKRYRSRHSPSSGLATEFKQRCHGLGLTGVTLHSYRYGWAERARRAVSARNLEISVLWQALAHRHV